MTTNTPHQIPQEAIVPLGGAEHLDAQYLHAMTPITASIPDVR